MKYLAVLIATLVLSYGLYRMGYGAGQDDRDAYWQGENAKLVCVTKEQAAAAELEQGKKASASTGKSKVAAKKASKQSRHATEVETSYHEHLAKTDPATDCKLHPDIVRDWNRANAGASSVQDNDGRDAVGDVSADAPAIEVRLREPSGWQPSYFSGPIPPVPDTAPGPE